MKTILTKVHFNMSCQKMLFFMGPQGAKMKHQLLPHLVIGYDAPSFLLLKREDGY